MELYFNRMSEGIAITVWDRRPPSMQCAFALVVKTKGSWVALAWEGQITDFDPKTALPMYDDRCRSLQEAASAMQGFIVASMIRAHMDPMGVMRGFRKRRSVKDALKLVDTPEVKAWLKTLPAPTKAEPKEKWVDQPESTEEK